MCRADRRVAQYVDRASRAKLVAHRVVSIKHTSHSRARSSGLDWPLRLAHHRHAHTFTHVFVHVCFAPVMRSWLVESSASDLLRHYTRRDRFPATFGLMMIVAI